MFVTQLSLSVLFNPQTILDECIIGTISSQTSSDLAVIFLTFTGHFSFYQYTFSLMATLTFVMNFACQKVENGGSAGWLGLSIK